MSIYREIKRLHRKLFVNTSPFAKAAITALVIGVGDLIATGTDIAWLIGDMLRDGAVYHPYIGIGLLIAFIVMLLSFYWLYVSIYRFMKNKDNRRQKRQMLRVHAVSHCGNLKVDEYRAPEYQQEYMD